MATPVVKWAGGKRQILDKIKAKMPQKYNNYFEPFIGGGALLLDILPHKATLNDVNKELLCIYRCLQNEEYYKLLLEELKKHQDKHSEDYYLEVRSMDRREDFNNLPIWERAARALYLNKACFNGLYRVNAKGYFNVPSGHKETVHLYDDDNIKNVHNYFMNNDVKILEGDFEDAVKEAKKGDFVYFDPPYDTLENKESFTSYSADNFGKEEQKRLRDTFKRLADKGVYVMLSNHNTEFIRTLYKDYNINIIEAKRMINSNANGRGNVEEVIITNY